MVILLACSDYALEKDPADPGPGDCPDPAATVEAEVAGDDRRTDGWPCP